MWLPPPWPAQLLWWGDPDLPQSVQLTCPSGQNSPVSYHWVAAPRFRQTPPCPVVQQWRGRQHSVPTPAQPPAGPRAPCAPRGGTVPRSGNSEIAEPEGQGLGTEVCAQRGQREPGRGCLRLCSSPRHCLQGHPEGACFGTTFQHQPMWLWPTCESVPGSPLCVSWL